MTLESDIEEAVSGWAEDRGWLSRKLQYVGRVGCPDRMFVGWGQVVFIEFKAPNERRSATQIREHARFDERGVKIHVVDDRDAGIAILLEAMKGGRAA